MNLVESARRVRPTTPIVVLATMYIVAGGVIHLTEWLDLYRHVPAGIPGAFVVRLGFPLNVATSLMFAIALPLVIWRRSRLTQPVIFAAVSFQAASLAALIGTRVGNVFGWTEPAWTVAADQTRAVEAAAIGALAVLAIFSGRSRVAAPQPAG